MEFFTADLHLGSTNIIKYCKRPFKSGDHQIKRLVGEINNRCKPEDTLYHVGDFILYGKERGVESLRIKPVTLEKSINCKLVHILGNHDRNNKIKGGLDLAILKVGKYTALLTHFPPWDKRIVDITSSIKGIDVYICGHVHDSWKLRSFKDKLVINVGVDVWNYRPVSKVQLIKLIDKSIVK